MSRLRLAGIAMLTGALAACDGSEPPNADRVRVQLERAIPGAEFRPDGRIRLGRFTLGLVKGARRWTRADDRETRDVLAHVQRIDIASYEVISLPGEGARKLPPTLARRLTANGWAPMVRARDEDSNTWIFVREDDAGSIRNLYIVELDDAELTVIDLAGRLDRVVAEMVADDPDGFVAGL